LGEALQRTTMIVADYSRGQDDASVEELNAVQQRGEMTPEHIAALGEFR